MTTVLPWWHFEHLPASPPLNLTPEISTRSCSTLSHSPPATPLDVSTRATSTCKESLRVCRGRACSLGDAGVGQDLLCSAAVLTCTSLQALRESFPPEPAPATTLGREGEGRTDERIARHLLPLPFEQFQSQPLLSTPKSLLSGQHKGSSTEVLACIFSGWQHRFWDTRTAPAVTTSTCNDLQRQSTEQGHPSRKTEPSKGCRTRVATQEHPEAPTPPAPEQLLPPAPRATRTSGGCHCPLQSPEEPAARHCAARMSLRCPLPPASPAWACL